METWFKTGLLLTITIIATSTALGTPIKTGDGSLSDPYHIKTCQQLQEIQGNLDATYELTQNINCEGYDFQPIGSETNRFKGYLDGNNHAIKNLEINKPSQENVGLFAVLKGRVHNIQLLNADVDGNTDVGIIAGETAPLPKIDEIIAAVKLRSSNVTGNKNVGGLAGNATGAPDEFSDITDIQQEGGKITAKGTNPRNIGGMIGSNARDLRFSDATNVTVHAPEATNVGGLVGNNTQRGYANVFFVGNVSGDFRVGGLIGNMQETSTNDIFTSGNVEGNTSVGGIAGVVSGGETISGGSQIYDNLIGYSLSDVTGVNKVGGMFGNATNTGHSGYAAGNVTGQTNVSGIGHGEGVTFSGSITNVIDKTTQDQSFSSQEDNIYNVTSSFLKTRSKDNNLTDYVGFSYGQITQEELYVTQDGLPINNDLEVSQQFASQNIASPTSISPNTSRILGKDDDIIDFSDRKTFRLPEEDIDSISSITVTNNGTIYMGLDVFQENTDSLYKFDSNFNTIWKQNLSSSCKGDTQNPVTPTDMVLTEQNNLIIQHDNEGGTKKINSDGTTEWTYCGGHTNNFRANKIALDTNGNIVAAGDGFESDIVKINSTTGTKIWNNTLEGQSGNALDVGPDNKIYYSGDEILKIANKTGHTKDRIRVAGQGSAKNVRARNGYIVISTTEALYKYDADTGGLVWRSEAMRFEDTGFSNYNPLAIDNKGRIFAGAVQGDQDNPYSTGALMKVSKTGEVLDEIEQKQYKPNVQNEFDYPELTDIDISDNGEHLIIASTVQSEFDKGPQLIKLDTQQPTPASVFENKENNLTILERFNDEVYSFGKSILNRTTKGTAIGDTNSDGKKEVISFNGTSLNTYNSTKQTGTLTGQYDLPRNSSTIRLGELNSEPDNRSDVLFRNQEDRIAFIDGNSSNTAPLGLDGFTNAPVISFRDSNGNGKYIFNNESSVNAPTDFPVVRSELRDIDDDGRLETAYNDNGNLSIIDREGNKEVLVENAGLPPGNSKLATGDKDNDGTTEIYYPNTGDSSYIYSIEYGETNPSRVTDISGSSASAIVGISDFNQDGDKDIVYIGTSQTIKYLDDGQVYSTGYSGIGSNNNIGIGPVGDFNNTGSPRVAIVDGSQIVSLIDSSGTKTKFSGTSASKNTLGVYDIVGDDRPEIFYTGSSGNLKYVHLNGTIRTFADSQGNPVPATSIISKGVGVPIRSHNPVDMGDFDTDGYEEVVYVSGVAQPFMFNYQTQDNDPVSEKISDSSITRNLHSGITRDIDNDQRPEIIFPNQSTGVQAIDHTGQINTLTTKITDFAGCHDATQCVQTESGQVTAPIDWTQDNTVEIAVVENDGNITILEPDTNNLIETPLQADQNDPDLSAIIKPEITGINPIRKNYSKPLYKDSFIETDIINITSPSIDLEGSTDIATIQAKIQTSTNNYPLNPSIRSNSQQTVLTSFFKPPNPGDYMINYTITDEHGGTTNRLQRIYVEDSQINFNDTLQTTGLLDGKGNSKRNNTNPITNTDITNISTRINREQLKTIDNIDLADSVSTLARSFLDTSILNNQADEVKTQQRLSSQQIITQDNISFQDTFFGLYNSTQYRFNSPQTWKNAEIDADINNANHSVELTFRAIDDDNQVLGTQTFNLQDGENNYTLNVPDSKKATYTIRGTTTSFNSWNVSSIEIYTNKPSIELNDLLVDAIGGQFKSLSDTIGITQSIDRTIGSIETTFSQSINIFDTGIDTFILDRELQETNTIQNTVLNRGFILERNPLLTPNIDSQTDRTSALNRVAVQTTDISSTVAESILFREDALGSINVIESIDRQVGIGRNLVDTVNADSTADRTASTIRAFVDAITIISNTDRTVTQERERTEPVVINQNVDETQSFIDTFNENINPVDIADGDLILFRDGQDTINTGSQTTFTREITRGILNILPIDTEITQTSKPSIDNVEVNVDDLGDNEKEVTFDLTLRDPDGTQNLDKLEYRAKSSSVVIQQDVTQSQETFNIEDRLTQVGTITLIDNSGRTDKFTVGFDISDNEYFGTGDADQQTLNKEDTITITNATKPIDYNISHLIYPETTNVNSGGTLTGTLDKGQTDNINTTKEGDYILVNRTFDQIPFPAQTCNTLSECPNQKISTVDKQYIQEELTIDNIHNAELEIFLPEPSIPRGFGPNATNFKDRTVTISQNYIDTQLNTDSGDAIASTFDRDVTDVNIGERETYFDQYEYVSNTPLDLRVEHQVTVDDSRYSYGSFLKFSKNNTDFNKGTFDVQQTNTCDDTLPRLSEASFYNQTWNGCAEDNNGNLIPELFTARIHINGDGTTYVRYGGFKGEPPEEAIKPFEGLKPCQPLGTEYEKQDGTTLKCYDPPSCDVDDSPTAAIGEQKSISCSTQDQDGIQDNVYLLKRDIIRKEVDRSAQMVQIFEGIGFAAAVLLLTSTIIYRKEYNKYPPGIETVAKQVRNL